MSYLQILDLLIATSAIGTSGIALVVTYLTWDLLCY